jgi:hypothetical protein
MHSFYTVCTEYFSQIFVTNEKAVSKKGRVTTKLYMLQNKA